MLLIKSSVLKFLYRINHIVRLIVNRVIKCRALKAELRAVLTLFMRAVFILLFFLGGRINSRDVWMYNSQLNLWIRVASLNKGRWRHKMGVLLGKVRRDIMPLDVWLDLSFSIRFYPVTAPQQHRKLVHDRVWRVCYLQFFISISFCFLNVL